LGRYRRESGSFEGTGSLPQEQNARGGYLVIEMVRRMCLDLVVGGTIYPNVGASKMVKQGAVALSRDPSVIQDKVVVQ
jgi:hypothetical protein